MEKLSESVVILEDAVISKIYYIRGQKVLIDRDLAALYGVKAIRLREQVKRNKKRFPPNFMFQLTSAEVRDMVSQSAIPSKKHLGGALPYAFTEHGVLMLANVLKSERAIKISLRLIEIFIKLREMVLTNKEVLASLEQLEKKVTAQDENIRMIFEALRQLLKPPVPRSSIGFRREEGRSI